MKTSPVRSFIRLDILDQVRDRGAMLARLGPTLIFVVGMTFGVISGLGDDTDLEDRRSVAIEGQVPATLSAALGDRQLERVATGPVHAAVRTGRAQAGLVRRSDGALTVVLRSDDPGSAHTARRVRAALAAWDASTNPRPTAIAFTTVEIEPEIGKIRRLASYAVPSALLFLLGGAFGNSAMQWHETRRSGALIHQLTLPISRVHLVMAKTTAEAILSFVAASPIIALLGLGAGAVVAIDSGTAAAIGVGVLLLLVSVIVVATFALGGLVASLRNPERVNQGAVAIAPVVAGAGLFLLYGLTEGTVPRWLSVLPVVGIIDVLRGAIVGEFVSSSAAVALASIAAAAFVLVRSVRSAPTDDLGLRSQ